MKTTESFAQASDMKNVYVNRLFRLGREEQKEELGCYYNKGGEGRGEGERRSRVPPWFLVKTSKEESKQQQQPVVPTREAGCARSGTSMDCKCRRTKGKAFVHTESAMEILLRYPTHVCSEL
jgi:hypothetical protein